MTMTASTPNAEPRLQPREREAELLADLVRLSRLTVLYGEAGAGKTTLLRCGVMPLLESGRASGSIELAIFFDAWDEPPLPALQARIRQTVSTLPSVANGGLGDQSLVDSLTAWQESLGVTFLIIFDQFEKYLAVPLDREGIREFAEEFVKAVNNPFLHANFLLSLRQDAETLLGRFRDRIPGLGDACLRLPALSHAIPPPPLTLRKEETPEPAAARAAPQESSARPEWLESWRQRPPTPVQPSQPAVSPPAHPSPEPSPAPVTITAAPPTDKAVKNTERSDSLPTEAAITAEIAALAEGREPWEEAGSVTAPPTLAASPSHSPLPPAEAHRKKSGWPMALAALAIVIVIIPVLLFSLWPSRFQQPIKVIAHERSLPPLNEPAQAADSSATVAAVPVPKETSADASGVVQPSPSEVKIAEPKSSSPPKVVGQATPAPIEAPETPSAKDRAAPAAPSGPMLYIQVRDQTQRARAERMMRPLAEQGIRVTGIKVVRYGPSVLDLRYFRQDEREEAEQVARALRGIGIRPQLKRIGGLEARATPRQYELWLAPAD